MSKFTFRAIVNPGHDMETVELVINARDQNAAEVAGVRAMTQLGFRRIAYTIAKVYPHSKAN